MRTRDKQRIFRRFMAGKSVEPLTVSSRGKWTAFHDVIVLIESIIREGVTKGWPTGLETKGR